MILNIGIAAMDRWLLKIFLPDKENWLRHANPWSIWTRSATLPFIVLAIWSRVWIGWLSVIPIVLLVVWIVINPTLFKRPHSLQSWGSKAVLGERTYMQRGDIPIPKHHLRLISILNVLQTLSGIILAIGLWKFSVFLTLYGMTTIYLSKMWFLDRMVWLYEETESSK